MSSASWILERHDGPAPAWKGVIDISKIRNDGKLAEEACVLFCNFSKSQEVVVYVD